MFDVNEEVYIKELNGLMRKYRVTKKYINGNNEYLYEIQRKEPCGNMASGELTYTYNLTAEHLYKII